MNKRIFTLTILCSFTFSTYCQNDIIKIIDDLTAQWDAEAVTMKTYEGFKKYCRTSTYRINTTDLLNRIHHYDTTLFNIVNDKYNAEKDKEAKATIDDIVTLETEYTTKSFLRFLHTECDEVNYIENNLARQGGEEFETEVGILEEELKKYVDEITRQIDLIDKHVHHLKDL